MTAAAGFSLSAAAAPQLRSSTASLEAAERIAQTTAQTTARPTLRLGSVGDTVSELQAMLKLLGYYSGPIDGFYREPTQMAVVRFQTAAGIAEDGIVGPTTWERLFPAQTDVPTAANAEPAAASSTESSAAARPAQPAEVETGAAAPPSETVTPPEESAETAPAEVMLPVLRQGMYGPAVRRLQERLSALDVYEGPIDGVFGPQTEAAVQQIQQQHELIPDGVVGPLPWSILLRS
ncbi:MAG: peptidoglycan-binding protein, partial [Leptolyngbya sp. SIO4C1]|nr:peptidoglycan-binding protein [Leptolyngbya sp. SIO4C1]